MVEPWAAASWGKQLGYALGVRELNRGWFAVNLEKEADLRWIQSQCWHIDHSPLLLKPWSPLFDASRERVDVLPIWVRLLALPLHFWDMYHFKRIGDILGTFLEADLSFVETKVMKVERILVNINLREGLEESINLDWLEKALPLGTTWFSLVYPCSPCQC